jgi:hypothetical protein
MTVLLQMADLSKIMIDYYAYDADSRTTKHAYRRCQIIQESTHIHPIALANPNTLIQAKYTPMNKGHTNCLRQHA